MKKISGKRSKTEADYRELARLEFQGGLYMGEDGPVIPSYVLEATLVNGAKKTRDGTVAKAAMFVEKNCPLEYEGPRDRDGLWADKNFQFEALVNVQRSKINRTRPIFNEWATIAIINYDDSLVNESQIKQWIENASYQVGLCELRPKYGRFQVEYLNGNGKID